MDAANTAAESGQAGDAPQTQIACTWASTSADPAKRERLGKVYAATGKWPVTPGVKRQAFVFESAHYADLEALAVDLRARMKDGGSALVAGRLKLLPRLIDRRKAHRRTAENFADFPCWVLFLDFDGLTATKAGMRIDRPEDFGEAALEEALKLLPAAFDADHIVYATSSSGLPRNAKGEPANGRAWFRLAFWLKRPSPSRSRSRSCWRSSSCRACNASTWRSTPYRNSTSSRGPIFPPAWTTRSRNRCCCAKARCARSTSTRS